MTKRSSTEMNAEQFVEGSKALRSPEELKKIWRHFKSGEGDEFMGVRMGQVFVLAKEFIYMPPSEIEKSLENPIHEVRVGAVSIMDSQAASKLPHKGTKDTKLCRLYRNGVQKSCSK